MSDINSLTLPNELAESCGSFIGNNTLAGSAGLLATSIGLCCLRQTAPGILYLFGKGFELASGVAKHFVSKEECYRFNGEGPAASIKQVVVNHPNIKGLRIEQQKDGSLNLVTPSGEQLKPRRGGKASCGDILGSYRRTCKGVEVKPYELEGAEGILCEVSASCQTIEGNTEEKTGLVFDPDVVKDLSLENCHTVFRQVSETDVKAGAPADGMCENRQIAIEFAKKHRKKRFN